MFDMQITDEEASQRYNLFVQRCLLGKEAKDKERNVVQVLVVIHDVYLHNSVAQ